MQNGRISKTKAKSSNKDRIGLACERCRKRHIRCPGGDRCSTCKKVNAECIYVEPDRKVSVALSYIQLLKAENATLKAQLSESKHRQDPSPKSDKQVIISGIFDSSIPLTSVNPQVSASSQQVNDAPQQEPSSSSFGVSSQMDFRPELKSNFGLEIPNIFLSNNERSLPKIGIPLDNRCKDVHISKRDNCLQVQINEGPGTPLAMIDITLPPITHATNCLGAFQTFLSGCFYFFNVGRFKYQLKHTYDGYQQEKHSRCDILWLAKLMLVLAIGEIYLGIPPEPLEALVEKRYQSLKSVPGISYFAKASDLIALSFDGMQSSETWVDSVEVLMLDAFFHQIVDSSPGYYLLSGFSLRTALIIGMHMDAEISSLNRYELEHRRRLWWTVYIIDRYVSAKSGFPISISDDSISAGLPSNVMAGTDVPPVGHEHDEFPDADVINSFIKVSQISSNMLLQLYQRRNLPPDILPVISNILGELFEWKQTLPASLRVDFSDPQFKVSRTASNILSEYFQCVNLTVRPLLLHFFHKRFQNSDKLGHHIDLSSIPTNLLTLLNSSLQTSVHTIQSLECQANRGLLAYHGYLDREYIFESASTLVLFAVTFEEYHSSPHFIQVGINLLKQMRDLGNDRAARRLIQLVSSIEAFESHGVPVIKDLIFHQDVSPSEVPIESQGSSTGGTVPSEPFFEAPQFSEHLNHRSDPFSIVLDPSNALRNAELFSRNWTDVSDQGVVSSISADTFDSFFDLENEKELWHEISERALWLGSPSADEFRTFIPDQWQ